MEKLGKKLERREKKIKSTSVENTTKSKQKQLSLTPELERDLIARNEMNIERFSAFLFPHSRTKDLDKARTLYYEEVSGAEEPETRALTVAPVYGEKTYTNRTYTTWLALLIWWYKNPTGDNSFRAHLRGLAAIKEIAPNGKNLKNIYDDLVCLSRTLTTWSDSFIDQNGIPTNLQDMHFIEGFGIQNKGKNHKQRFVIGRINPDILRNLIARKTNPKNLTSINKIRAEIGQVLYRYIDTRIYNKAKFEKNSLQLFRDLELNATKYKYLSKRIELLERIIKELDQLRLTTGNILEIDVIPTSNNKDVKIVCHNIYSAFAQSKASKVKPVNTDKTDIKSLAHQIQETVGNDTDSSWVSWTEYLAKYYSSTLIHRAIGEYREKDQLGETDIDNPCKYFTNTIHRIAHSMGVEWVGRGCTKDCKYRPENNPTQESLI